MFCCDGGFVGGVGASAYALLDMNEGSGALMATGGVYLQRCKNAFEAEVVALDTGIRALLSVLPPLSPLPVLLLAPAPPLVLAHSVAVSSPEKYSTGSPWTRAEV